MEYLKKNEIIKKAVLNGVTSENVSSKLSMEEIIYLDKLRKFFGYFYLETVLYQFVHKYNISDEYKSYLKKVNIKENRLKQKYEKILYESCIDMPDKLMAFMSGFLTNILYSNFTQLKSLQADIKNDTVCQNYIKTLEKKLKFEDIYNRVNFIQYVKRKYSNYDDSYYADLISRMLGSEACGLLYITYEKLNLCI